ncbi:hypothetical protein D0Y65_046861 [Glycine soja]|uniref:Uncharacterized protein n=1 Tax=Glycine soja TaxID=3848 RepID=A0A445GBE6_GLYSO|nr:hypothetical protein D0Y65_046861 [Glycine soja]
MNSNSTLRFDSIHDFPRAFENKEIVASSTIVPHADVFLATYCKSYIKVVPTLKLGGLGFAFPKGSSLAIDISRATLKAIESGEGQTHCGSTGSKIQNEQLGSQPFFGLFAICGAIGLFVTKRIVDNQTPWWKVSKQVHKECTSPSKYSREYTP